MDMSRMRWRYTLTEPPESGIMAVDLQGFALCPKCGRKKLCRLRPETEIVSAGLWCKRCGEVEITIMRES